MQHEQVDIGARQQQPPPVSADRGDRRPRRRAGEPKSVAMAASTSSAPARRPHAVMARRVGTFESLVLGRRVATGSGAAPTVGR